jgi:hypothetical protein
MKKKNILIISTSDRCTVELINIVKEIKKRNHNFFFLYTDNVNTQYPHISLNEFTYDSNITEPNQTYTAQTLGGITLPFIPDVLLVSRENWEPERSMFIEFKQLGTLICCVENSSWLHAEIDSKLELYSRKSYPTNLIDVFFDHSDWVFETKKLASWITYKTKIVGNSKFDDLSNVKPYLKTKPIIIVYGSMNKFIHSKIIEETKNITEKTHQEYELFYKPHPVEFIDFKEEFSEDFGELKNIPYIKVIKDEQLFQSVVKSSDFNIGIISSIMYYPLVLNKKTIIFNTEDIGVEKGFDIESYKGKMYNFWAPIVKVNSFEEFIKLVDLNFIENTIKRKNYMMNIIKENLTQYDGNFKWLTLNKNINHDKILQLFDNFNDFKASERIVNEIENLYA